MIIESILLAVTFVQCELGGHPTAAGFPTPRGQQPAAANAGPAERSFSNARQTAQGELAVTAREEADWAPALNRPEPDANVGTFPGDGGIIRALHARYSAPTSRLRCRSPIELVGTGSRRLRWHLCCFTLEAARRALRADDARLNDLGRQEDAKRLNIALTRIDEAQHMAGQLNQDANALAADAAKTINDVL